MRETMDKVIKDVRAGKGPVLVEAISYRWFGHSTSDPGKYRTKEEVDEWKKKDPILKFRNYLLEKKLATVEELDALEQASHDAIEAAVDFGRKGPEPSPESAFEDIFTE